MKFVSIGCLKRVHLRSRNAVQIGTCLQLPNFFLHLIERGIFNKSSCVEKA